MNRKRNKESNQRLDEFLDNGEPQDDFEKEALEGFQQFERDEVTESLNELDARFSKKLQASSKTENRRGYWVAAAALLIVSSFTGYFLLQNSMPEKDLAIKQETPKVSPQTPEEKKVNPSDEQAKSAEKPAPTQEHSTMRSQPVAKAQTLKSKSTERSTELKGEEESTKEVNANLAYAESDMVSAPLAAAAVEAAPPDKTDAVPPAAPIQTSPQGGAGVAVARDDEKQMDAGRMFAKKKSESRTAEPQVFVATSEGPNANSACYYSKGETDLQKLIADKLKAKNLLKKFDAKLFINLKGSVDSLQFINPYRLNTDEQLKVKNELKGVEGFKLRNSGKTRASTF